MYFSYIFKCFKLNKVKHTVFKEKDIEWVSILANIQCLCVIVDTGKEKVILCRGNQWDTVHYTDQLTDTCSSSQFVPVFGAK